MIRSPEKVFFQNMKAELNKKYFFSDSGSGKRTIFALYE